MKIAIIQLEKTLKSSVYAIEELFYINNNFCKQKDEIEIYTKILKLNDLENSKLFNMVIIPPLMSGDSFDYDIPKLNKWLINQHENNAILCSACVGSFFLANTKLLDNKKATTHWAYSDYFKEKFPNVILNTDKILVDEKKFITAGGVTAYMDLCLYIIEKYHSNKTASALANLLVIDKTRESQKSYKSFSTIFLFDDDEIKKCANLIKENLKEQYSNKILANYLNLNERTFTRRFKKALNTTPNKYMQNLRIEKAKELLITTNKSFDSITFEVGFYNESSFRKLFKRETSLNPSEFRKRYKQTIKNS